MVMAAGMKMRATFWPTTTAAAADAAGISDNLFTVGLKRKAKDWQKEKIAWLTQLSIWFDSSLLYYVWDPLEYHLAYYGILWGITTLM